MMTSVSTFEQSGRRPGGALLQRKCDCGKHTSGGQCSSCRRRRGDSPPQSNRHRKFEQDSSTLSNRNRARAEQLNSATTGLADLQRPVETTREVVSPSEDRPRFSSDGILMTLDGSGTCTNGGGLSVCDLGTGRYIVSSIDNTCCTRRCTEMHENVHITDIDGFGCCSALSTALQQPGADRNALIGQYNEWLEAVRAVTECNAYTVSVQCADALAAEQDCSSFSSTGASIGGGGGVLVGAGIGAAAGGIGAIVGGLVGGLAGVFSGGFVGARATQSDCCADIAEYREATAAQARSYCARADSVPPCPSFVSPTGSLPIPDETPRIA